MVLDLQLAAFAIDRNLYKKRVQHPPREMFPRRQYSVIMSDPTALDRVAKNTRNSTWRRAESHNKQLQHFLDRERFQQNASWRAEFERLSAIPPAGLQPHVAERMQALKEVIVNQAPSKTLY